MRRTFAGVTADEPLVPANRTPPRGLYARLAVDSPAEGAGLYRALVQRMSLAPEQAAPWSDLRRRTDIRHYRPERIVGVAEELLDEGGQKLTALRSPTGRYLYLTPVERELWQLMDGTHTVAELATIGFMRFQQLVLVPDLVASLRTHGFLTDPPVRLYSGLRARLERNSVGGFGRGVLQTLHQRTFALEGVDGLLGGLYRFGGRLLFTPGFLALLVLISLIGLGCFMLLTLGRGPDYSVVAPGNVVSGLFGFWIALLCSFVLHELAHALAVKHFGRHVPRAGVMLYYGMPAAFVDTSDIWLAGRWARILVSLAGPLCDLLVGSLAAILALSLPPGAIGAGAYKLALAAYLAALFNLNPLLELDGYFILSDWLRLPNLRRRALAFISGPLWVKLRHAEVAPASQAGWPARVLARLRALPREERIYTLYGVLTALYTLLAVLLAFFFWQNQLLGLLRDLWAADVLGRIAALLLGVGIIAPLVLGLIFVAWAGVRGAAAWAARREYGRSPGLVALAFAALAVTLTALPLRYGLRVETALLTPLLWLAALGAQLKLQRDYRGARLARALDCFLIVTVIELIAQGGYLLQPNWAPLWAGMEIVGFVLLGYAAFVALLDVDLQQARTVELSITALMLGLAFLAGGLTIGVIQAAQPDAAFLLVVVAAAPIYGSTVALAMLLPQLIGLRDSRLFWSWLLLWIGIAAQTVAYLLELLPAWRNTLPAIAALVLASGLWAAAWVSHLIALRQVQVRNLRWPLEPALGEGERLRRGFQHSYAGLYRSLREHYGVRRARALDDRLDVLGATADWQITLDRERARISAELAHAPLDVQGARYAEVLRYTVATIRELAGAAFAHTAVRAAYDALPWPEREAANRHCFVHTPWAAELSRVFGDVREARLRLLRQVELFAACDDTELAAIAGALEQRQVAAGDLLIAPGAVPEGLWIVEAGEVALREGERIVAELRRGAAFGALEPPLPTQSYRASIPSDLLYLPPAALQWAVREAAPHAAEGVELLAKVRLLERLPIFHDLSRASLHTLAKTATRIRRPPRSIIVRQGQPSGAFYVIADGYAAIVRQGSAKDASGTLGPPKVVARLGPAEFFGEIELVRGTPPVASVVSVTDIELVAVPHHALTELLAGATGAARGIEQIGSGRELELRAMETGKNEK
jgi:putative peptide zinc metalloprotease protein